MRAIADTAKVVFILVGMGSIRGNMVRLPQAASRVTRYTRFEPQSREEGHAYMNALSEVPVADSLSAFTHKMTRGFTREIQEAIKGIERFGLRNPPDDPNHGLTLDEMAGQVLFHDRKSSAPITVPEA